ncbi:hypothetical protein DNTS_030163 [Danionella cerebrum]|uniref:Uncharacterized protein n=1 Tax=Danionella cerebrum TaxID=2873325 RepID=A0A553Q804_9TELE|nr:hypothetical protein DNTS_030163 [Danionella translucida]
MHGTETDFAHVHAKIKIGSTRQSPEMLYTRTQPAMKMMLLLMMHAGCAPEDDEEKEPDDDDGKHLPRLVRPDAS